ncbi:MAG: hypothetical protein Q7U75_09945, partial [Desulfobacterales bacterium]|nr:hypothetical protein [Desulfobacterales bacterium]
MDVGDVGDYFVVVTNPNGSASSFPDNDVRVTLRGAFVIEAEDYNFGAGQTVEAASVMPLVSGLFHGMDGLQSVDFFIIEDTADSAAGGNNLRNGWTNNGVVIPALPGANVDVVQDNEGGNSVRPDFTLTNNYKLGWSNPGEWFQYTRTFPPGRYSAVFVGAREGRAADVMGRTLELVTGDRSQPGATTAVLGELLADGTGGWSSHDWVPFLEPAGGGIAEFDLSGPQTLRLRHSVGDGDDDAILLYRLPSSVNSPPQMALIDDQFMDEGQTLSLSLIGSDSDLPEQTLTFSLV